jgi:hypothetical protein
VESSMLAVDPQPHGEGWSFASGLVTREDGAKVQPESMRFQQRVADEAGCVQPSAVVKGG